VNLIFRAAPALTVIVPVGCSVGHSSTGVRDLHDLASSLGCAFVEDTDEHELYTSDQGACRDLTLYAFDGARQRESWLALASDFGGNYLVGTTWVVAADEPSAAASAQSKIGGQRR
jgi:hypothetical protein